MRLEVGYGLESKLTDAISSQILRQAVAPRFREGKIADGIAAGLDAIDQAIAGTYKGAAPAKRQQGSSLFSLFLLAIVLAGLGSIDLLPACGDKFLVSSRGTRYQRAPVAYGPAAILIYTNPASEVPKALASVSVASTLSRAGYRPTVVGTAAEFEAMLSRGGWDRPPFLALRVL